MKGSCLLVLLALAPLLSFGDDGIYEVRVRGRGQLTLSCGGEDGKTVYTIGMPSGGPFKGGAQNSVSKFLDYGTKVRMIKAGQPLPPSERVPNCMVTVANRADKFTLDYFLLPYFHDGFGLYDPKSVERFLPEWRKSYALPPDREFTFCFEPEAAKGRTLVYLDGSLSHSLDGVRRFVDAADAVKPSGWNSPVTSGGQAYGAGGYKADFAFGMVQDEAIGGKALEATLKGAADGKPHTKFEWAAGSAFFKRPVEFKYEPGTALALRICGNSSFGKVALAIQDAKGKTHHLRGMCYRDYLCFHGWHTLVARLPKAVEPGTRCKLLGVWFGSAEWTLDPKEMVPVTDPIRLKDVMIARLPAEKVSPERRLEAVAADVMKTVSDKDL